MPPNPINISQSNAKQALEVAVLFSAISLIKYWSKNLTKLFFQLMDRSYGPYFQLTKKKQSRARENICLDLIKDIFVPACRVSAFDVGFKKLLMYIFFSTHTYIHRMYITYTDLIRSAGASMDSRILIRAEVIKIFITDF